MRVNIFDKVSFVSIFLVLILLPIFFIPYTHIPVETAKGLLVVLGLAVGLIFWIIGRIFDGKVVYSRSVTFWGVLGVVFALFLSSIFSSGSGASFFGTLFDIGSFWFIFSGFILMFASSILFRDEKDAHNLLFGIVFSCAILLIFQAARFVIPGVLSLGVLGDKTETILGSWNALGFFAGFSALLFLMLVEFFPVNRGWRILLKLLILLSLFIIACVNFPLVWLLLGISALIIFVYKISIISAGDDDETGKVRFPALSLVIIMLSLLFFMSSPAIRGFLPDHLGLSNTEVSPSFGATMSVAKSVLVHNPVFGLGPNRFSQAWALYKPAIINTTPFWDVSFDSGSGLLPTFAATTGYLGIVAWLVFFILLFYSGLRVIFSGIKRGRNWEMVAFFVLALYLFLTAFVYSAGVVVLLFALAFSGIFIGLASSLQSNEVSFSFLNDQRKSFFAILALVLLMVVTAGITYKYVERFASVPYFRSALAAPDIATGEQYINKALGLYQNDLYLRTYSQIYLLKLGSLVNQADTSDTAKAALQPTLDAVVHGGDLAIAYNPKNYLNFTNLGLVYQSVASLGVKDGYTKAVDAYKVAEGLNPLNPGIRLAIANSYFALGQNDNATALANEALGLKPDYINALLLLSQIAKREGNMTDAITYAERALAISPSDKSLLQYRDSLKNAPLSTPAPQPAPNTPAKKN